MKWQRGFAWALTLAGVPLVIFLIMLSISRSTPPAGEDAVSSVNSEVTAESDQELSHSKGKDIGGALMLDPQGDIDLAKRVIAQAVDTGIPQVVLSRRVIGGELPCLGAGGTTYIEMHPMETFGLVVLRSKIRNLFPGGPGPFMPDSYEPYYLLLYDLQRDLINGMRSPPYWAGLRSTFGGSAWPEDSPMYVSAEGQPGLGELDDRPYPPIRGDFRAQEAHAVQSTGGWTVTVARTRSMGDWISIDFTVVGPRARESYFVDQPYLQIEGKELRAGGNDQGTETMGPSVHAAGFRSLPESPDPHELSMRFVVPAIHARPARNYCQMPDLKPEEYPTPTRIPDQIPAPIHATLPPDVEVVGPFTFDLKVLVEPKPTEPVLPTPIPTAEGAEPPPLPMPTGQP